MAIFYGALRGKPDRYKREDNSRPRTCRFASSTRAASRGASQSMCSQYRVGCRLLGGRPPRGRASAGVASLAPVRVHQRGPKRRPRPRLRQSTLFDWPLGRVLPPSGNASADDLQDLLSLYLDQCKNAGGEIYASARSSTGISTSPSISSSAMSTGSMASMTFTSTRAMSGRTPRTTARFTTGASSSRFPIAMSASSSPFRPSASRPMPPETPRPAPRPSARSLVARPRPRHLPPHPNPWCTSSARHQPERCGPRPRSRGAREPRDGTQTLTGWRLIDKNARATTINTTLGPGQAVSSRSMATESNSGTRAAIWSSRTTRGSRSMRSLTPARMRTRRPLLPLQAVGACERTDSRREQMPGEL